MGNRNYERYKNMRRGGPEETMLTQILGRPTPCLNTEGAMDYVEGKEDVTDFKVITLFGETKLRRFGVIVEMYDKKAHGRVRREYLKQFTEAERNVMSAWYLKIYAWFMRSGIPRGGVRMSIQTYCTLCRFADFFATV